MRVQHGGLVIDTDGFVVERAGQHLHVEPQVFDVLAYLVTHRDRVVPKEELLDEIWGDRFVSESALTSRIKSARQLVGDSGAAQRSIKTVHGRGYRWVGELVPVGERGDGAGSERGRYTVPATVPPPRALTSLVGRERDVDGVRGALREHRLVTLVGPPGVGKSRLASEVASGAATEPDREVAFADLRTALEPGDVLLAVRRSVNVTGGSAGAEPALPAEREDALAVLVEHLRKRRLLLVLDNCEHLGGELSELCPALLGSCPDLAIVATGRRSLAVGGEFVWVLEPLPAPPRLDVTWSELMASDAGRLFVERSRAAGARWEESRHEASRAVEICRRLGGLPLAIELAATRTRWLSLDDLLRQLTHGLEGDAGPRDDPLQVALRSSRSLLDHDGQRAFDALSVFAGSFTIDAALSVVGAVCPQGAPLTIFEALVGQSLVDVIGAPRHRYRMLEPIRRYAESCRRASADGDAAVRAHAEHYTRFVERRWPAGLISTRHPWSLLATEKLEVETAARRLLEVDHRAARRLLGALGWYWWLGGDAQVWEWMSVALEAGAGDDPPELAARFALARTLASVVHGRDPGAWAQAAFDRAMESEQWSVAAWALAFQVAPDAMWADLERVSRRWDEIVSLFRRDGDVCGEAWALVLVRGHAEACAGLLDRAATTYQAAAGLFHRCGDEAGRVRALLEIVELDVWQGNDLARARRVYATVPRLDDLPIESWMKRQWLGGLIAEGEGDLDEAVRLHRIALTTSERHLPAAQLTNTYRCLTASVLRRAGRPAEAAELLAAAIEFALARCGSTCADPHVSWVLESTVGLLVDLGETALAADVVGVAEHLRQELDAPMPYWDVPRYRPDVDRLRGVLGEDRFRSAVRAGHGLEVTVSCRRVQAALWARSAAVT